MKLTLLHLCRYTDACDNSGLGALPTTLDLLSFRRMKISTDMTKWHVTNSKNTSVPLSKPENNTLEAILGLGVARQCFLWKSLGEGGRWQGW